MWDEITYPFPNFSGAAVEVEVGGDKKLYSTLHWPSDYLSMLSLKLIHTSARGLKGETSTLLLNLFLET